MAEISRRQMLSVGSCGFGALAFSGLSNALIAAKANPTNFKVRAKRVIFLCMPGGPAHLDTFDYKPQTTRPSIRVLLSSLVNTGRAVCGFQSFFQNWQSMQINYVF